MSDSEVLLRLSKAEAIVLLEWLASLDSLHPPSEEKVLWKVEGQLESISCGIVCT
jgi:hypothetical protein